MIEAGDTITSVNGFRTEDPSSLLRAINTSSDGRMTLAVVDKNTGRVERWAVTAARNPGFAGDKAVGRCVARINEVMARRRLHPSVVPNTPFDLTDFNLAVFEVLWQNVARDIQLALKTELNLPVEPFLRPLVVRVPATNRHLVTFARPADAVVRGALQRAFGLGDDGFADVQYVAQAVVVTTGQFKPQFRPADVLDLRLVRDGIRQQFESPGSVVRRSDLSVSYSSDANSAYAKSPWNPVALGGGDRGVSQYYWALHSGVQRRPEAKDEWAVGSVVAIGQLPKGEFDPLRIRELQLSDNNTELARHLRVPVSAAAPQHVRQAITTAIPVAGEKREFVGELSANGNKISLLDYAKQVLDELKSSLLVN